MDVGGGFRGATSVAVNLGGAADLRFSADTGGVPLPLILDVCQTNPSTGACLAPPAPSVTVNIPAGGTPTFSVSATGTGVIPFDPANTRRGTGDVQDPVP